MLKGIGHTPAANQLSPTLRRRNLCLFIYFVSRFLSSKTRESPNPDGTRVVAMSPDTSDRDDVWGVLRNSYLIKVFLPQWTLRVFTSNRSSSSLPPRILRKLLAAGATMSYVPDAIADTIPIQMWSYLIVDDPQVEYFVIRRAKQRLSERGALAIHSWMSSNATFHCVRDHPLHKTQAIVKGLWGARRDRLRTLLGYSMREMLENHRNNFSLKAEPGVAVNSFLSERLWPTVQDDVLCHDSVSPRKWPGSVLFERATKSTGIVGALYDSHETILPN